MVLLQQGSCRLENFEWKVFLMKDLEMMKASFFKIFLEYKVHQSDGTYSNIGNRKYVSVTSLNEGIFHI